MQIISFTLNPYMQNNTNTNSFGNRITKRMQLRPFVSEAMTDQLLLVKDEIIGNLPKDFIALYRKRHLCANYKKLVKQVRDIFGQVSDVCEESERIKAKNAPDLSKITPEAYFSFCKKSIDNLMSGNFSYNQALFEYSNPELDKLTGKKINKILQEGFVRIGLIAKDDRIETNFLAQGDFGYTFQISATDKDGNKLFSDKVFKYYKDTKQQITKYTGIARLKYTMLNSVEDINQVSEYIKEKTRHNPQFRFLADVWLQDIKDCTQCKDEHEYVEKFREKLNKLYGYNGVIRESNVALFLKKSAGHKPDAAEFYFADKKKNYILTEFIPENENCTPITLEEMEQQKEFFRALGLEFEDINPSNFISGKLIDYGEFRVANPILANSAISRRYYKKIKLVNIPNQDKRIQEQIKRLNYYYSLASNNKLTSADEVIAGLNEAKKLIPKENRESLIF